MPRGFLPLLMVLLGALPAAALPRADDLGWTEFRNERFGLALRYPAEVFVSQRSSDAGDGDLFETPDGKGRLLVGAIENTDRFTPRSYQAFIARQSYPGLRVDYAPVVRVGLCYPAPSARRWSTKKSCLAAAPA